jgi:hypothetical protein
MLSCTISKTQAIGQRIFGHPPGRLHQLAPGLAESTALYMLRKGRFFAKLCIGIEHAWENYSKLE